MCVRTRFVLCNGGVRAVCETSALQVSGSKHVCKQCVSLCLRSIVPIIKSKMNNSFDRRENYKRKREKKKGNNGVFLKKTRYQAKKGMLGRGSPIDKETYEYFLRILQVNIEDFPTDEDKSMFVDNVMETTRGREKELSCNQLGCRAFEKFLPMANIKTLFRVATVFSQDLHEMICHEFGSFVVQQLFASVVVLLQKNGDGSCNEEGVTTKLRQDEDNVQSDGEESDTKSQFEKLRAWVVEVARFAFNNLEELMFDVSGNHILRVILECLSGLPLGSTCKRKKQQYQTIIKVGDCPISEGPALVQECGQSVYSHLVKNSCADYVFVSLPSVFLQTLLYALRKVDKKLCRKLTTLLLDTCYDPHQKVKEEDEGFSQHEIPKHFEMEPATALLDAMILTARPKSWSKIYTRCFSNNLLMLSFSSNGNFCVQNLIKQCQKKDELEAIFDSIANNFEQLLSNNRPGIIYAFAESCQRLSTRQKGFIEELQTALHCVNSEQCAIFPILVAYLIDFESWARNESSKSELKVSLFGSLILQTMLKFAETIKIVNSLLSVETKQLEQIFCDTRGCFIADAYFTSQTIGNKSREKMVRKLQGSYTQLACSKFGSRAFDAVWNWSPLNCRKLILKDLALNDSLLNSSEWGSFIKRKSGLDLFKRRPQIWEENQTKQERTLKLFADIIS